MATALPIARIFDEDPRFIYGMNSLADPERVRVGAYSRGWNVVSRGGAVSCRPGFKQRLELPAGTLQGMTMFHPTGGEPVLLFVVSGIVYFSYAPFDGYSVISSVVFDSQAPKVSFCQTEQAVVRNSDNSLTFLDKPRALMIMQDGRSAPAYWDGAVGGHIHGADNTPGGEEMVWCADRLWVSRGNQLFASDIYNPISFWEGQYIGPSGIGSFVLPAQITALSKVPSTDSPIVLVFTEHATTALKTYVRDRTAWATTANFQTEILPDIGCVSARSVAVSLGQLWWYSKDGVTSLDMAQTTYTTAVRKLVDQNMELSKSQLDANQTQIAATVFDGFLLVSVPFEGKHNQHTWVLDLEGADALQEDEPAAWCGWWTGIRPVQWATGTVYGANRIFVATYDHDGFNRIWEAFQPDMLDNGCPITWGFETRGYTGGITAEKGLRYAKIAMASLSGVVDVKCSWAGSFRGAYLPSLMKRVVATPGTLSAELEIAEGEDTIYALRHQSRDVLTEDVSGDEAGCSVETENSGNVDTGFTLCFQANGPGAVRGIRVFLQPQTDEQTGACESPEDDYRAVRFDGLSEAGSDLDVLRNNLSLAPQSYFANVSVAGSYRGYSSVGAGSAESVISLACAQKQAEAVAYMRLDRDLGVHAPFFVGSTIV